MGRTKWYVGYTDENCKFGEVFGADNPKEATPEASGYLLVSAPHDTKESAEEELNG